MFVFYFLYFVFSTLIIMVQAESISITLKPFAEVQDYNKILLGEVADIKCESDCDFLNYVQVSANKNYITKNAVLSSLNFRGVKATLLGNVTKIKRSSHALSKDKLTNRIKNYVNNVCKIKNTQIKVSIMEMNNLENINLEKDAIFTSFSNCISGDFRFYFGEQKISNLYARLEIFGDVVVTTKDIYLNSEIDLKNLRYKKTKITATNFTYSINKMKGYRSKCFIKEGSSINNTCLQIKPDILRGDIVQLFVKSNDVLLSSTAKALKDGKAGETITAKNLFTGKRIQAKVVDSNALMIEVF